MNFIATCLFGLEKLVGSDIEKLGCERISTRDGRVEFTGPESAGARSNVNFRYAERVMIKVGEFKAESFDSLFEGTKSLPWEDYILKADSFPVKGHSVKSKLFSVPDCQSIIKKAVCDRLGAAYGVKTLPETGQKKQIVFFIMEDLACLMLDTTGEGLRKRGYRPVVSAAPIRETLAAAMVSLSRPRQGVMTVDPMCGSGTIPIEGALLASNTPPGAKRSFAGEENGLIPKQYFTLAREEGLSAVTPPQMEIFGFDIDGAAIDSARENAGRAGVGGWIKFETRDAAKFTPPNTGRGTIVTNPPYGERMMDKASVAKLEEAIGKAFMSSVPDWHMYFLSSDESFERNFGRRANKKRILYNGPIKCFFYQYFKR